ncbi:hypothetical protein HYH02_006904 [Chlamydomonas schloesseri]|uniref:Uncharacterized protein n=1 Tax=Chlamydomonas schloesseri TaxID=2026947 RepID=A0A835WK54_9CHLO|nr:hypothetical protein HYH02_006904 [Chlamydomonas schloesseri]|eukprot:KAG2448320.1 hypothetical protein HYH02_006904 [Chlamydomonas schloesseri]
MRRSLQPYGPRPLQHHHQQWQRHSQLYPQQQAYARHLSPQQQQQQQQQMPQLVLLGKRPHPGAELGGAAELEDDEVSEDECGGGDYVRWAHGPHIAPRGPWRGPAAPLQQQQMPQQLMLLAARPEYAQPLARAATASPHPQLGQQLPIDFESPRGRIVSAIPVVMAQRAPDGAALPPLVLPSPEGLPSMQQQQHWHQDQYARQQQRLLQQQHLQQVALAQHQQAQQRQLQEYQAWQARQPALQSVAPQWQVPQDVLQPSRQLQGPQQRQAAGPASSACAPMPLPNIFDDVPLDVDLGFDLALEHELGQDGMGEAGSEAAAGEPVITLEAGLAAMGCAEDLPGGTTGAALAWAQSYGAARRGSLADSHSPPAGSSSPQTAQAVMAAAATLATAAPRTTGAGRSSSTGSRPEQQVAPPSNGCAAAANLETASAGGVVACTHAASGGRGGSIGLASSDLGRDAAPAQQGMMTGPQPTPASIPSPKRPTKMKSLLELAAQLPDVDPYPRARILNPHLAGALQPSHGDAQKPGLESCDSSAAGGCGETARTMTTPAAGGRNFGV